VIGGGLGCFYFAFANGNPAIGIWGGAFVLLAGVTELLRRRREGSR
jgi:hypothetical protein